MAEKKSRVQEATKWAVKAGLLFSLLSFAGDILARIGDVGGLLKAPKT